VPSGNPVPRVGVSAVSVVTTQGALRPTSDNVGRAVTIEVLKDNDGEERASSSVSPGCNYSPDPLPG
jgi:hypothetical protein